MPFAACVWLVGWLVAAFNQFMLACVCVAGQVTKQVKLVPRVSGTVEIVKSECFERFLGDWRTSNSSFTRHRLPSAMTSHRSRAWKTFNRKEAVFRRIFPTHFLARGYGVCPTTSSQCQCADDPHHLLAGVERRGACRWKP